MHAKQTIAPHAIYLNKTGILMYKLTPKKAKLSGCQKYNG